MDENQRANAYAAREAYQDMGEATSYDRRRFSGLRGRLKEGLDRRALSLALRQLPATGRPRRLLDIPCGTGRLTRFLLEQGHAVVGADISAEMMRVAKARVQGFDSFGGFHKTDAADLEFEDDAFDCIISIRFMGHIPDAVRPTILREYGRVSRYAIVEYSIESRVAAWRQRLDRALGTGSPLPDRWGWRVLSWPELAQEIDAGGMQLVRRWAKLPLLSDSHYLLLQRKHAGA